MRFIGSGVLALALLACGGKGFDGKSMGERLPEPSGVSAPASPSPAPAPGGGHSTPNTSPSSATPGPSAPASPATISFSSGLDEREVAAADVVLADDGSVRVVARVVVAAVAPPTAYCHFSVRLVSGTSSTDATFPESALVTASPTELRVSEVLSGDVAGAYRVVASLLCTGDLIGAPAVVKVSDASIAVAPVQ